jgi:hypothetical protein
MVVNEHLNLSCLGGSSNWRGFDVWRKSAQVPQQLGGSRRAVTAERHPPVGCRKFARPWWHLKPPGGTIKRGLRWISQDLWLLDVARVYILYIYMFINYIYIFVYLYDIQTQTLVSRTGKKVEPNICQYLSIRSFQTWKFHQTINGNSQCEPPASDLFSVPSANPMEQ